MELISTLILIAASAYSLGQLLISLFRLEDDHQVLLLAKYALGLICFFSLVLLGVPISVLLTLMWIPPIALLGLEIWKRTKKSQSSTFGQINYLSVGLHLVFLCTIVYISYEALRNVAFRPITEWDARSIWYFHAKQLFFANGLNANTGFGVNEFTSKWSHPEYPLMVPSFAAMITRSIGYWNEFLPKTNLYLLWIGFVLGLMSLKSVFPLLKIVIFVTFFSVSPLFLTNGYNDVWLGVYSGLGLLHLLEYLRLNDGRYLISSIVVMAFCSYMKQDAFLLILAVASAILLLSAITTNFSVIKQSLARVLKLWPLLCLLVIPFVLWTYHKSVYHLGTSEYDFGRLLRPTEYSTTFAQDKIDRIYNAIVLPMDFEKMTLVLVLTILAASAYSWFQRRDKRLVLMDSLIMSTPLVASVVFALGMHVVYCMSTADLTWHLQTSADRLRVHLLFLGLPTLFAVASVLSNIPQRQQAVATSKKKSKKQK